jgi:transposase, IS30 family
LCADLPKVSRQTLTWDQGRAMADWIQLEVDADIEVYFCDPHSPWRRPSNQHMNGLLRQYFPKGTDLNLVTRQQLNAVALEMNGRPRKVLGWRTPAEVTLTSLQPPPDRAQSQGAGEPRGKG